MIEDVGVVGVGAMGRPMAACLLKAGFTVTICPHVNLGPVRELAAQGARVVDAPGDVAAASEVVITMVPDSPQVEEAVLGPNGIIQGAAPGSAVIDMSTISPITTRMVAERLAERGVAMLDAPVSGGPTRAATGTLTIMVGGEEAVLERCRPVLAALGSNIVHVGGTGMGEVVKLVNQLYCGLIMIANAEALTFGVKAGLKAEVIRQVVGTATGGNYLLEHWLPLNILRDNYEGGFALDLMHKDLSVALSAAGELGVPLMAAGLAQQLYTLVKGLQKGRFDYSVVSTLYQDAANVTIATGEPRARSTSGQ